MIIVEFTSARNPKEKLYFLGQSLADVLADTANGTSFGGTPLQSQREVNLETVQKAAPKFLQKGLEAIFSGDTQSFYVGSVKES